MERFTSFQLAIFFHGEFKMNISASHLGITNIVCICLIGSSVFGQKVDQSIEPGSVAAANIPAMQTVDAGRIAFDSAVNLVGSRSANKVRFFSFGPIEDEKRNTINEDTAILWHLIKRSLSSSAARSALGITVNQTADNSEAIFVQGHGLILIHRVGLPVAPLQSVDTTDDDDKEELSEWERAKRDIESAGSVRLSSRLGTPGVTNITVVGSLATGPDLLAMSYDPDYAEQLNRTVTGALRNAARNFRNLDPEDSITVFIHGPSNDSGVRSVYAWRVDRSDSPDAAGKTWDFDSRQYLEPVDQRRLSMSR